MLLRSRKNKIKHVIQTQLFIMKGIIYFYMFRFQRNRHHAVRTKYLNHVSSLCFYITLSEVSRISFETTTKIGVMELL